MTGEIIMSLSVSKYLSYFVVDPCSWLEESEDIKTTNKRFCLIYKNKSSIIVGMRFEVE